MTYAALAYAPARPAAAPAPRRAPPALRPAAAPPSAVSPSAASPSAGRYRDAELAAATPGQLVVMLFDKCVLTVRRARAALAARDVAARTTHVCAAVDMVAELRASLDHAAAPELSGQLSALYGFVIDELLAANRRADDARFDAPLRVLAELREGFAGAQAQLARGA